MANATLAKYGFPLEMQEAIFEDLTLENQEKILKAYKCMENNIRVVYVVGSPSLEKNKIIALLAKFIIFKEKGSISLVSTPSWNTDWQDTMNYVILTATNTNRKYIDSVKEFMFEKLANGSIFIIDCSSIDIFIDLYGDDMFKYASSATLVFNIADTSILTIKEV